MANTVNMLKTAVAGYMQRDTTVFVRGSVDVLLQACNNARLYAERRLELELAKVSVDFPGATLQNGVALSAALLHGTATPVVVKKIRQCYLAMTTGGEFPVDLINKRTWSQRLKRKFEGQRPTDTSRPMKEVLTPFVIVQDGGYLFVYPPDMNEFSSTFTIYADVYKWLPAYTSAGTENDFLLDFCFDWMIYRCVWELNYFLKEDDRVLLSTELLKDAWDAMVKWNNELVESVTDDTTLD